MAAVLHVLAGWDDTSRLASTYPASGTGLSSDAVLGCCRCASCFACSTALVIFSADAWLRCSLHHGTISSNPGARVQMRGPWALPHLLALLLASLFGGLLLLGLLGSCSHLLLLCQQGSSRFGSCLYSCLMVCG